MRSFSHKVRGRALRSSIFFINRFSLASHFEIRREGRLIPPRALDPRHRPCEDAIRHFRAEGRPIRYWSYE